MNVKTSQLFRAVIVMFATAGTAFCINSTVGNPTIPPSQIQSGLTPNPIGRNINAGNNVITGNVGGGKAFQGVIPYGSPGYIQAPQNVGTTDVETFIQNSTGVPYATDRTPAAIQPYYSPYRSVSSLSSRAYNSYDSTGSSALQIPQQSPLRQPLTFGLVPLAEAQNLQQQNAPLQIQTTEPLQEVQQYGTYRPLSSTPLEMEQYITEQIGGKLYPTEQLQQAQTAQQPASQTIGQNEKGLELTSVPSQPLEAGQAVEPIVPGQLPKQPGAEIAKNPGIFEEMEKKAHDEFEKNLQKMVTAKQAAEANQPSEPNASATGPSATLGISTTFATQTTDRFNTLMKAGEGYIKQKQYYKAADAYTLAAIYQSKNPLPYAGKAHALFGAGEYMSSAYFLSRAIQIFPDYTRFKIDLASMFGDKDLLEKRIADISARQEKTNSPELQFLLAYIYFQTGQLEPAQRMINGALVQMPQSQAAQLLKKAIQLSIEQAGKTGTP